MEKTLTAPSCERKQAPIQCDADSDDINDPKPARNLAPGERWAFTDHRTMAEIIAEGLL
jgi:hypothetical protein